MRRALLSIVVASAVLAVAAPAVAQKISVKSATPASGEQGSVGLDVVVAGSGFGPGAQARFVLSGSDNPDGVAVRSTRFVSASQLVATLDIADTASLASFDIKVTLSGRTGKGTDLFQVVQKGGGVNACATTPLDPARFELIRTFNSVLPSGQPAFGPWFGASTELAPAHLAFADGTTRTVLVAVVGTRRDVAKVEIFLLDPSTGELLDGRALCPTCAVQQHVQLATLNGGGTSRLSLGNVNSDGIPDFVVLEPSRGLTTLFVSTQAGDGTIGYSSINVPEGDHNCCADIALGDLDGLPGDEVAIGNAGGGNKRSYVSPAVYLYRVSATNVTLYRTVYPVLSPALDKYDSYATTVAIGDVTGDGRPDLVVGAKNRTVGSQRDAGEVLIHPGQGPSAPYEQSATAMALRSGVAGANGVGAQVAIGEATHTGTPDVVALTFDNENAHGQVFPGPVVHGQLSDPTWTFAPDPGAYNGWFVTQPEVGDVTGDGLKDIVVGTPYTSSGDACALQGTVYLFIARPTGGWTTATLQSTSETDNTNFGVRLATADGYPFLLVSEDERNLGDTIGAGQVYLYRVKP